jgi:hypothetical protein
VFHQDFSSEFFSTKNLEHYGSFTDAMCNRCVLLTSTSAVLGASKAGPMGCGSLVQVCEWDWMPEKRDPEGVK